MEARSVLAEQLSCGCPGCWAWRRVGSLLAVGHDSASVCLHLKARLDQVVTEVLNEFDKTPGEVVVAATPLPSLPGEAPGFPLDLNPEVKGKLEAVREDRKRRAAQDLEEEEDKKKGKDRSRSRKKSKDKDKKRKKKSKSKEPKTEEEQLTPEIEGVEHSAHSKTEPDTASPEVGEDSQKEVKKSSKEKKRKKSSSEEEKPRPSKALPSSSSRPSRPSQGVELKENPKAVSLTREELEKTPAVSKRERSRERREPAKPPGDWRPRPRPPSTPPPGWRPPRTNHKPKKPHRPRNKGWTRWYRGCDISWYGKDADRKDQREAYQSWWKGWCVGGLRLH